MKQIKNDKWQTGNYLFENTGFYSDYITPSQQQDAFSNGNRKRNDKRVFIVYPQNNKGIREMMMPLLLAT